MLKRLISIYAISITITLMISGVLQPAWACRCYVGNAQTTDEERIQVARDALSQTHYAVIGTITATSDTSVSPCLENGKFSHRDGAVIVVEEVVHGAAPHEIAISEGAGNGVYDGRISSNLLGTCGMTWKNGERNLWLLLQDDSGGVVLASGCAHSFVRNWLYPELKTE